MDRRLRSFNHFINPLNAGATIAGAITFTLEPEVEGHIVMLGRSGISLSGATRIRVTDEMQSIDYHPTNELNIPFVADEITGEARSVHVVKGRVVIDVTNLGTAGIPNALHFIILRIRPREVLEV